MHKNVTFHKISHPQCDHFPNRMVEMTVDPFDKDDLHEAVEVAAEAVETAAQAVENAGTNAISLFSVDKVK